MSLSSSSSPCAACKYLRRKCTPGCVFAPYFPPDQQTKFACVHRVFGTSNVAKLLNELTPSQREDAANSLAYEAEARLLDPVYGCVAYIWLLQHRIKQVQRDLYHTKKELSAYLCPTALANPFHVHHLQQLQAIGSSPSTSMRSCQAKPPEQILTSAEHQRHVPFAAVAAGDGEQFGAVLLVESDHRQRDACRALPPPEELFSLQHKHMRTPKHHSGAQDGDLISFLSG